MEKGDSRKSKVFGMVIAISLGNEPLIEILSNNKLLSNVTGRKLKVSKVVIQIIKDISL